MTDSNLALRLFPPLAFDYLNAEEGGLEDLITCGGVR